jgi:hypothetical protein
MNFFIKTLSVALVALVSLMVSCSKSSSENPNSAVAGTWTMTTSVKSGCTDPSYNNTETYGCPATAAASCLKLTFNTNGSLTVDDTWIDSFSGSTSTDTGTGTFSISGTLLKATVYGSTTNFTYSLSADKKTLTLVTKNSSTGCTETDTLTK